MGEWPLTTSLYILDISSKWDQLDPIEINWNSQVEDEHATDHISWTNQKKVKSD